MQQTKTGAVLFTNKEYDTVEHELEEATRILWFVGLAAGIAILFYVMRVRRYPKDPK